MENNMRVLGAIIFLSFLKISSAFASEQDSGCRSFIEKQLAQATHIIHDADSSFLQKHTALISLFQNAVDIGWIGRTSAGMCWRNADKAQQQAFDDVYSAYLSDYYVGSLNEEDLRTMADVKLTKYKRIDDATYMARIEITQTDDDPVEAYLKLVEDPSGRCRIRDFKVEGVAMLASQQEEISSLGAKGGLAYIIERLAGRSNH